jgi:1,4-dihydroxy-2-naphthoate polyprenyltransferase
VTELEKWRIAARTHTLPAAIVPVLVGSGLAWGQDVFRWDALVWALIGALAIQVAANFANDASDAVRGADTPDRVGPPRMVSLGLITPRQMWTATWLAIAVAAVAAGFLTAIAGPLILAIGAVSVVAMLGYVGGPVPYGYRGLGEVFVFVFFGLVATVGSRFVHDASAPAAAWLLAIPVGLLASAILLANNYRDMSTDATAGKRTLAVALGGASTRRLFTILLYGAIAVAALFAALGWTPRPTVAVVLVAPLCRKPIAILNRASSGPELIEALKATARIHLLAGVVLAVSAALPV